MLIAPVLQSAQPFWKWPNRGNETDFVLFLFYFCHRHLNKVLILPCLSMALPKRGNDLWPSRWSLHPVCRSRECVGCCSGASGRCATSDGSSRQMGRRATGHERDRESASGFSVFQSWWLKFWLWYFLLCATDKFSHYWSQEGNSLKSNTPLLNECVLWELTRLMNMRKNWTTSV